MKDFIHARTHDGKAFRLLTIIDEHRRDWLAIVVARLLTNEDVLDRLTQLFVRRGAPDYIRSDNGGEFTAKAVRQWLWNVGGKTFYIGPKSPWENGYLESFNDKPRDELLNGEILDTLLEAQVLIERGQREYNPHFPYQTERK